MVPDQRAAEYTIALTLTLLIEAPLVAAALARWYRVPIIGGVALGLLSLLANLASFSVGAALQLAGLW